MMLRSFSRTINRLQRSTSGNATMLVALAMPALIGGSGLAVDTAQWYMWKRELQFAVDQSALAGAWARSNSGTRDSYVTRARQEFTSNTSVTTGIDSVPTVGLAGWNGGHDNSVVVRASASRRLPFSSFLTGRAVSVGVYAQATFTDGANYTACLIATSDSDSGAITIGGNATLTAACGLAALSTSASSIVINGNPTVDPGTVVSKGGIDSWLAQHTDADIHEYVSGLSDPFASLTTPVPNPNPALSYTCTPGATTTRANTSSYTEVWKYTYTGTKSNALNLASQVRQSTSATSNATNVVVPNGTVNGTGSTTSTVTGSVTSTGSGNNKTYSRIDTVTIAYTTYSAVNVITTQTQASLSQGTYAGGFDVSCTTVFAPGIYVIDGGRVKVTGQYQVTGTGVMFILKNGAYIDITGGSTITLTAATSAQLQSFGLSATQAAQFEGMLVYEDRNSAGTKNRNKLNGNSQTIFNGKFYLPKSDVTFNGTAGVTSRCLLIAAKDITLEGNTNMSTFCPAGGGGGYTDSVGSSSASIKLVA